MSKKQCLLLISFLLFNRNREITEAREKRITEERKKREQTLEKLKQKTPHDLLTTSFFQQWDQEENNKKMQEEWAQYLLQEVCVYA